jgi:hypothetical protein
VQGPHTLRYVVARADVDPYVLAEDGFVPLLATTGAGGTAPAGQALDVTGAEVSSVRRGESGCLEVRVFNPTDATTSVGLGGRRGWLVDLRGRPVAPVDGAFDLGPWKIATVALMGGTA